MSGERCRHGYGPGDHHWESGWCVREEGGMSEKAMAAPVCEHFWAWVSPAGSGEFARLCMTCHQPSADWLNEVAASSNLADFPNRLAAARAERGASMRDVAAATGLTLSTIHKTEHGGDIRLSTVIALLRWLNEESR